jgi:Bacterial PH domain
MTAETYKSKIDTWLLMLLVGTDIFVLVIVWSVASLGAMSIPVALVTLLPATMLPLWILVATRYDLTDDFLLIRSGPFRWRVAIADITSVAPTRNPLSSPALSLDRLRIDYGQGRAIMISPSNRDDFVRALEARRKLAL